MLNLTRDDVTWWIGIVGGIAIGLSSSFSLFPWISVPWQHGISLVAFIYAIVSAKLATSPLPGKPTY